MGVSVLLHTNTRETKHPQSWLWVEKYNIPGLRVQHCKEEREKEQIILQDKPRNYMYIAHIKQIHLYIKNNSNKAKQKQIFS